MQVFQEADSRIRSSKGERTSESRRPLWVVEQGHREGYKSIEITRCKVKEGFEGNHEQFVQEKKPTQGFNS